MFWHVFLYRFKCLLRDKETVFWTLIFPILLATLFYLAFGHLTIEKEKFNPIVAAVVNNGAYQGNIPFKRMMESLSEEGDSQVLTLILTNKEEAEALLKEGAVSGVITVSDTIGLTVKESGINQSILKAILDDYGQTAKVITSILSENPEAAAFFFEELGNQRNYTEQASFSGAAPETNVAYFYALIAMACMYSAFWGLRNIIDIQPDLSATGARRSLAPTHKIKVILADGLAALSISFAEIVILLVFLRLVLGISFGDCFRFILLTCFIGCIAGVSFGNFIGTVIRGSESLKNGILIGAGMAMSFLAGLMWVDMKNIVSSKAPVLSYINPAALISDAFYSLYIFDTHKRFFINIALLCVISTVMYAVSFTRLRGEKYASI